jgi:hypothetical protein
MPGGRPKSKTPKKPPRKKKCTGHSKSRGGLPCENWAMEGYDVCSSHGAGTKKRVREGTRQPPGAPLKTGRYADKTRHKAIADLIRQFENDPDPINLFSELAASRALFIEFINRYEEFIEALLAWHQSWSAQMELTTHDVMNLSQIFEIAKEAGASSRLVNDTAIAIDKLKSVSDAPKPRQVLDISDSYRILAETTKIAERIKKIEFLEAVGKRDLHRIMGLMAAVVAKHVPDELIQDAIAKEWREIRI